MKRTIRAQKDPKEIDAHCILNEEERRYGRGLMLQENAGILLLLLINMKTE